MTKWSAIHNDVHIVAGDNFHFIKLYYDGLYGRDITMEKFIRRLDPDIKIKIVGENIYSLARNILRMRLCKTLNSTFCLAEAKEEYKSLFYIGMRSKKDLFKLKLKWPDLIETKTWSNQLLFYVRVIDGDSFSPKEFSITNLDYGIDGLL